jgi:hypothetical protein
MNGALLTTVSWEIKTGFLVSLLFPFVTRVFWPWHLSWWGWNTVLLELSIAGTLFPSVLHRDFGIADLLLTWSQVVFLGLVVINVLWRTVMIWRTQRAGVAPDEQEISAPALPPDSRAETSGTSQGPG